MNRLYCMIGVLVIGLMTVSSLSAEPKMNELTKVFYHRVDDAQGAEHIDLGKVVFYFAKEPIINALPTAHDKREQSLTFFFPMTQASSQAKSMIKTINKGASSFYRIHIEQALKPIPGIKFTITFDPDKVDFYHENFDSISLQKGLVFRFFNKVVIAQLNSKHTTMLRTACAHKPGVVIDCGHGGSDDGTVGFFNIKEKDVTRSVGLQVAQLLKQDGYPVFLTRKADESVELDERTTFANTCKHAALMVSIHANSAPNVNSRGVETFCLTNALFKSYAPVPNGRLAYAKNYLNQLHEHSSLLAHALHDNVLACVKKKQNNVIDRKVKNSVSQVLVGSTLPSALIEIGFLSNHDEAQLLRDKSYQQLIARGIYTGIRSYFERVNAA